MLFPSASRIVCTSTSSVLPISNSFLGIIQGVSQCSFFPTTQLSSFHSDIQFPVQFVEKITFSPFNFLFTHVKNQMNIYVWVSMWALQCSMICLFILTPIPYFLDYWSISRNFEIRSRKASTFLQLSHSCFGYFRPFVFPYELSYHLVSFYKSSC